MNAIRLLRFSVIFAAGIVLAWPGLVLAQRCETRAVISVDTDVYESLPRFVTGRGWQGTVKARLAAGTPVFVCWEQATQFGLTTKAWRQIAFRSSRNTTEYGWVMKDFTRQGALERGAPSLLAALSPLGAAWAETPPPREPDIKWSAQDPPPQPPAASTPAVNAVPEDMLHELIVLYGPLFLAMVLGMVSKATADWLDKPVRSSVTRHVRSGMIAVLVSPIVFLGFLNAGQFSVNTQTYLVLLLLAFQNGFFWQTVLRRTEAVRGAEDKAR